MSHIVYMARHKTLGGAYIGISSRTLFFRQREHLADARSAKRGGCRAFHAALRKYGPENFEWTVLLDGLLADEAAHLEMFLIAALGPRYNISRGGESGGGGSRSRPVVCVNTGRWYESGISAANSLGVDPMTISRLVNHGGQTSSGLRFRYADSEEVIRPPRDPADIEAGRRSRVEKLRGRRHPPETIERLRTAAKKRGISAVTRTATIEANRKPIVCNETGTIFPDAAQAALAHGLKRSHIYDLLFKGRVSKTALVSFRHALPHERGMMNAREAA